MTRLNATKIVSFGITKPPLVLSDWQGIPFILSGNAATVEKLYGLCDGQRIGRILFFQKVQGAKLFLVLSESPFWHINDWFYCFAETNQDGSLGDWYWLNLNQVIAVSA